MVTEQRGVHYIWSEIICVILKQDERAVRVRFEIIIVISDRNCRHDVQLPLYYSNFEILKFNEYQCRVVEKWKQKAYYINHFIFETETMLYRAKMVRFRTEMK